MVNSGRNGRAAAVARTEEQELVRVAERVPEHCRWELQKIARQMREDTFLTSNRDSFVEELVGEALLAVCVDDAELSLADLRNRILALKLSDLPCWQLVERRLIELSEPTTHFPATQAGTD